MDNEDNALSNFMKQNNDKAEKKDASVFGFGGQQSKSAEGDSDKEKKELTEKEKELQEAKKQSKALEARIAFANPELAKMQFRRMLMIYGAGAIIVLLLLYANYRNPDWLSKLFNSIFNSIFFR